MQGRISIDALLQRKGKGELTGPDRVFLALLALGDLDSSDDDDSDILTQTIADDLALMMME